MYNDFVSTLISGCEIFPSDNFFNQTSSPDLTETVPDYFNGVVLQRSVGVASGSLGGTSSSSSLKFTVAFNLAVVWMLIFVSLSKGLKSYGKVVHGFVLAPIAALFILAFKMVGFITIGSTLFGQTAWDEFFFNTQVSTTESKNISNNPFKQFVSSLNLNLFHHYFFP